MNSITILNKEGANGKVNTVEDRVDALEKRIVELEINLFTMLKDMVECMEKHKKDQDGEDLKVETEEGMGAPFFSKIEKEEE
jgi:hypothetical protein